MSDNLKKRLRILAVTAFFLVFLVFPVCLYVLLRFGFPPVIGNLLATRNMTAYAAQVHPGWVPEGGWANYNLVDDGYYLSFTDGTQSHSLGCSGNIIQDTEREAALRAELDIDKALRINGLQNQHIYWTACWSVEEPDCPLIRLDMDIYDREDAPILDEAGMRERMAEEAVNAYEALCSVTPVHSFSVGYCHQGIRGKDPGNVWYIIRTDLSDETALTREDILTGSLTVR